MRKKKSAYKLAVGLHYDPSQNAGDSGGSQTPKVEIRGDDLMADDVVKIARRFGIPVVEKPELARALSSVEIDSEIPEELFEAVAATLNEIEKRTRSK